MRMRYMCAFLFRHTVRRRTERERERRARESVHRRRLCDQESARLQRPLRNQLDVVCGTGLYRLGGTFLGLYQVRRVAGESDEDREVRLQALHSPLELVVSVLVTVVSFTLTCFSSHLIVKGLTQSTGTVRLQWACCQPPPGCGLLCSESAPPSL